jgi:hypothetical protein
MGERLLAKIYTQAQLEGMDQKQFDAAKSAAKSAESKRLVVLRTAQVA